MKGSTSYAVQSYLAGYYYSFCFIYFAGSWMAVKMSQDGNELELGLIPNKSVAQSLSFTDTNHFLKNSSRDHLHELLDDTTGKKEQAYERVESKTGECSQHSPFLVENLNIKEKHYFSTKTVI